LIIDLYAIVIENCVIILQLVLKYLTQS